MSSITVSDLTFCYPGSYDPIFEHASFVLDTDWKLGFVGRNGRGKIDSDHVDRGYIGAKAAKMTESE